jgi:hypothetical protein
MSSPTTQPDAKIEDPAVAERERIAAEKAEMRATLRAALAAKATSRKTVAVRKTMSSKKGPTDWNRENTHPLLADIMGLQRDFFVNHESIDTLTDKYAGFFSKYKELFNTCISRPFEDADYRNIEYMINTHDKVRLGEITYQQASKMVSARGAQMFQPELLKK